MREFIAVPYPLLLRALLAFTVVAAAWAARRERVELRRVFGRRVLAGLAALFVVALAARLTLAPRAHYVFEDEVEHVDASGNLAASGTFGLSMARGPGWTVTEPPLWPAGFHVLAALAGGTESAAYGVNATLGAATPPLAAAAALLLFDDAAAAVFAGALLLFWPSHLRYSGSAALVVNSVFWIVLTLAAWGLRRRRRSTATAALLAGALAYALQCRLENFILLPFLLPELGWPWALLPLAALTPPAVISALNGLREIPGYSGGAAAALRTLVHHLPRNAWFFLDPLGPRLPLLALAAGGLIGARKSDRRAELRLLALAASLTLFYSAYHIGEFARAAGDRYALVVDALMILAAAGSAARLWRWGGKPRWAAAALGVAAALLVFRPGPPPALPPGACEYSFLRDNAASLDPDGWLVAYPVASALAATGRAAVSPALLAEDPLGTLDRMRGKPAYLVKDEWWEQRGSDAARVIQVALLGRYKIHGAFARKACGDKEITLEEFYGERGVRPWSERKVKDSIFHSSFTPRSDPSFTRRGLRGR